MLTIFNRKELFVAYDMGRQAEIRNTLTANGIDYKVKVVNHSTVSLGGEITRARTGSFGENANFSLKNSNNIISDRVIIRIKCN